MQKNEGNVILNNNKKINKHDHNFQEFQDMIKRLNLPDMVASIVIPTWTMLKIHVNW